MNTSSLGSRMVLGLLLLGVGTGASMLAAVVVGTNPSLLPSIPDPILDRLPYFDTGVPGEVIYSVFVLFFLGAILYRSPRRLAYTFAVVGMFYLARAAFQLLLPLGHPADAPLFDERFHFYPFPFAYFPSGHVGNLVVLACLVPRGWIRVIAWSLIPLIAFGTFVARTHYVADALGSLVIGYAVFSFAEKYVKTRWFGVGASATD